MVIMKPDSLKLKSLSVKNGRQQVFEEQSIQFIINFFDYCGYSVKTHKMTAIPPTLAGSSHPEQKQAITGQMELHNTTGEAMVP